jgi:hypothetical protein
MHAITIDQGERLARTDWPATPRAQIPWDAMAIFEVPTVLDLAPGECLGVAPGILAIKFVDRSSLLEQSAPINVSVRSLFTR